MDKDEKELWRELQLWFPREELRKKLKEISQMLKDTPSLSPNKNQMTGGK